MRSDRTIHVVSCHAAGEVGDVIVGGVATPPGDTLWEQSRWIANDNKLRQFVLNEPRGGVFRHVNLLVPPKHPAADMGFIIMEPVHTPPMSGSNAMCVATVLLETGIVPMVEPITHLKLEAPAGLISVEAHCASGKVTEVRVANVASFAGVRAASLEVEGYGTLTVDTAYGGDTFVVVDAAALGFALDPSEAGELAQLGPRITAAATQQLGFAHPDNPDWSHISFCQFAGPMERSGNQVRARGTVAIEPGKLDRSPTGTGCSARMALLHANGLLGLDDTFVGQSILGSEFRCRITGSTEVDTIPAVLPEVAGTAWITGTHQLLRDPTDPWPEGYRLADTWPGA